MKVESLFETTKKAANIAAGHKLTKGLKDGHCNRDLCQASLSGKPQAHTADTETGFSDGRLYYCAACAKQFDAVDDRLENSRRCEWVVDPE